MSLDGREAMEPSSRTPEGWANRCPVCGKDVCIEPSTPPGDAPCPHCGHLLWFETDEQERDSPSEPGQGPENADERKAVAQFKIVEVEVFKEALKTLRDRLAKDG